MRSPCSVAASLFFLAAEFGCPVSGLDNGFTRPALGWSSWFAAPSGSQVTDAFVRASAEALVSSGLAQKGYRYINVDEGWLKGRLPNGTIYEDLDKFPDGMRALGDWVRSQPVAPGSSTHLMYGLYSCRGTRQCHTDVYQATGSYGHEAEDTQWMIDAGARWLKMDSCKSSQDHGVAFSDYAKFRDAMNKSGEQVWFNLCGWRDWYAPPDPSLNYGGGHTLGNSYRISDDGGNWGAITEALNVMAELVRYARPGGYPDPDNILGPHGRVGSVTESQARVQMVLWSMMPTQLILGEDVTQMSAEFIETVGNEELIAVNQDAPFVAPAKRIVGGNLTFPCGGRSTALQQVDLPSNAQCENIWSRPLANGDVALAMVNQGVNATIVCDAACFAAAGLDGAVKVKVRDMIAHSDLPELSPPFELGAEVAGQGAVAAFRLTPVDRTEEVV